MQVPGGTGYQVNQPSAERLIQIQYGADVPSEAITAGDYVIMSIKESTVLGYTSGKCQSGDILNLSSYTMTNTNAHQKWTIEPVNTRQGSDFSYFYIKSKESPSLLIDIKDWNTSVGGKIIGWAGNGGSNEQWLFEYAGNNNWYIRSRHSGLYLEAKGSVVSQNVFSGAKEQQWRFMPIGTQREQSAPKAPKGLTATAQSASILLSWDKNSESDVYGYQILRAKEGTDDWDVIGRMVTGTEFLDNVLTSGQTYTYKVMAIDKARNRSVASETVTAKTSGQKGLIAHYKFENTLQDESENMLTAQSGADMSYSTIGVKEGSHSAFLNKNYILLPKTVADNEEMTIATWVNNLSATKSWTRIFDFGNGTDQYMFLTPSNGSEMRFVMKNGGDEQILSAGKLGAGLHHVAVTIGKSAVTIYVDGEEEAESTTFTIKPTDIHAVMNFLGRSQYASDELFAGNLDDFRIYNYALTANDVKSLYNGQEPVAIRNIEKTVTTSNVYFDMSGRKVTSPSNGAYIKNGKKVIIK